ncbi:MAG: DUF3137 domain-containing protein [Desulfobacteraceae bacterium]|nr:DUF3137 domain-containing protein [Desulfobacteraceae bacterium]
MKTLENFYQSDLLPHLEKLENQRRTVKKKFVQAAAIAIVLNLVFWFISSKFSLNLNLMFLFLVVSVIFTFFPWYIKYFKGYKAGFKDTIIPKIVRFIDNRLQYDKDGMVSREDFLDSHLFNDKPGEFRGDDLVTGTLDQTAIRFSEVHARRVELVRRDTGSSSSGSRTRKKYTPIFDGLFFMADFNKSFKGTTIVLPDTAQKMFGNLGQALQRLNVKNGQLIKLEDPEFEKLFVVYGQDQVEARYVLSTSLMRRIVDFQNRARREIRLSFSSFKLHVAIPFDKELFEPKIMGSILGISHVREYYENLKLVIDIVEELNLNTRIWTQKRQVSPSAVAAANPTPNTMTAGHDSPAPMPPETGKRKRLNEAETVEAFSDFINKADDTISPKIKSAKQWLKRIAGAFLILLCLPFLLFGAYTAGLVILGIGLYFLAGGFLSTGMEQLSGAILFTGIGIVIALSGYSAYKTGVESRTWPTVDGVIIKSEIEEQTSTTGEGANKKTEVKSYAKIAYEYRIDGQKFESKKISFSQTSGNAKQVVDRYRKGTSVRVYYNPDKPKQAVLVAGNSGLNVVPFIFAGVFVLFGIFSAVKWRKQTMALGVQR